MSAPRKRFTSFTLDNAWNIDFPTDTGARPRPRERDRVVGHTEGGFKGLPAVRLLPAATGLEPGPALAGASG